MHLKSCQIAGSCFVLFQFCNCAKTAASHVPRRKTPLPVTWSMAKFGAQCFASTTLRFYFLNLLRNCSGTYFNFREKHCKSAKLSWPQNIKLPFWFFCLKSLKPQKSLFLSKILNWQLAVSQSLVWRLLLRGRTSSSLKSFDFLEIGKISTCGRSSDPIQQGLSKVTIQTWFKCQTCQTLRKHHWCLSQGSI